MDSIVVLGNLWVIVLEDRKEIPCFFSCRTHDNMDNGTDSTSIATKIEICISHATSSPGRPSSTLLIYQTLSHSFEANLIPIFSWE